MVTSFKRLIPYFSYLKPVWFRFALGILFGVLYSVSSGLGLPLMAETVFPILFGNHESAPAWLGTFVDQWFPNDVQGGFLLLCCILIPFVMLLRALGAVGNGYFMTYTGVHVVQAIQIAVFRKLQSLPMSFFQRYRTGELMAALKGYPTQIKHVVVDTSNDLVKEPLTLISALGFLVYKAFTSESFLVASIGLVTVPIVIFPIRQIGRYLAKRAIQLVRMGEALQSSTIESVQSPLEIRAYNLEESQNKRFESQLKDIFRLTMKSVRSRLMISPSIEVVAAIGLAFSLYLGVRTGMTEGDFMALAVALYMAYGPIKKLGHIHAMLKTLEAPLSRLEAIIDAPESVEETATPQKLPSPVRGRIDFEDVHFTYSTGKPVLAGVSVTIHPGETVALVGQSGSGKTTFVNLIPRFFDPISGTIRLDGIDTKEFSLKDLRDQIAYVPQMPILFNASIIDNIRVGKPDADKQEVVNAAKQAQAHDFIMAMPKGYHTILSEKGNSLSGGQRQRIAIARAIIKNAPILVFDEATSALDNKMDSEIQEALKAFSKDRTTLIIAHRMNSVRWVKRRLYFENKAIVGDGVDSELRASVPGYVSLMGMEPALMQ